MTAPLLFLDLARLFVGVAVLSFAAYTDWRWRRAPNVLWSVSAAIGVVLLVVQAALDQAPLGARWPYLLALPPLLLLASEASWADAAAGIAALVGVAAVILVVRTAPDSVTPAWPFLVAIPVFAAVIYALWYFGLIAGGADAKAFIAFATLVPFPIGAWDAGSFPVWRSNLPGSVVFLENSLLLFLVVPLGILVWNLAHGSVRVPHMVLGVKRRAADVRRGHAWPMEFVQEDGSRKTRLFASRMPEGDIDAAFERLQALGETKVWVSPKVPFMVPMLAGYVATFVVGDMMTTLIQRAIVRA